MSLVIEIIQPDGARTRHRLNGLPLTLGRALANDIVVEDPYVDATHARLTPESDGTVVVDDLGSVNGIVAKDERLSGAVLVRPGDVLRIGRTTLRFRDPNEILPPALLDHALVESTEPASAAVVAPRSRRRFLTETSTGLVLFFVALAACASNAWLGDFSRSGANEAMSVALGVAIALTVWAGLWSIASRAIVHRFRFMGHLAVASAMVLAALGWEVIEQWLQFFFPHSFFDTVPAMIVMLAMITVLVAAHLSFASTMSRRRQWRVGAIVAGVVLAITGLGALTKDDSFSDVPKFPAVVKPIPARLVPTKSVAQFEGVTRGVKDEVDQLAKK
ncbi:MAG TPA: FHA domain-containing protein [Gemmatimonadaceae bacterium]